MLWAALFIVKKLFRFLVVAIILVVAYIIMDPSLWQGAKDFYSDEIHPRVVDVIDYIDISDGVSDTIPTDIDI